jgi:hypothetical protein
MRQVKTFWLRALARDAAGRMGLAMLHLQLVGSIALSRSPPAKTGGAGLRAAIRLPHTIHRSVTHPGMIWEPERAASYYNH